jgi:hypothetical protein
MSNGVQAVVCTRGVNGAVRAVGVGGAYGSRHSAYVVGTRASHARGANATHARARCTRVARGVARAWAVLRVRSLAVVAWKLRFGAYVVNGSSPLAECVVRVYAHRDVDGAAVVVTRAAREHGMRERGWRGW